MPRASSMTVPSTTTGVRGANFRIWVCNDGRARLTIRQEHLQPGAFISDTAMTDHLLLLHGELFDAARVKAPA
jgi:hypothetical protein